MLGISPSEWERMTPAELNTCAFALRDRRRAEERGEQAKIYNLAALIRPMVWSRHPPDFDEVFPEEKPEMDDEAMLAVVRRLNRMMGGTED